MDDRAQPPRRTVRPGRMVGRVLGIPLYLNASMLLLAVLVTVVYGGFVQRELDLPARARLLVGFGFVVCLLGSVLLHELGHALTARRLRHRRPRHHPGAARRLHRDGPGRADPAGGRAGLAGRAGRVAGARRAGQRWPRIALPDRTVLGQIAFQLAASNLLVAVFNVLPGLPLDGGRALRAVVWALLKDRNRATVVAGWAGRVIALATARGGASRCTG